MFFANKIENYTVCQEEFTVRVKPIALIPIIVLILVAPVSYSSAENTEQGGVAGQREVVELNGTVSTIELLREYIDPGSGFSIPINKPTTVVDLSASCNGIKYSDQRNESIVYLDGYTESQLHHGRAAVVFARFNVLKGPIDGAEMPIKTCTLIDDKGNTKRLEYQVFLYDEYAYLKERPVAFYGWITLLSNIVRIDITAKNSELVKIKNLQSLPERTISWDPCLAIGDSKVLINYMMVTSLETEVSFIDIRFSDTDSPHLTFTVKPKVDKKMRIEVVLDKDKEFLGNYEGEFFEDIRKEVNMRVQAYTWTLLKDLPLDITVYEKDASGKEVVTVKHLLLPLSLLPQN